MARLDGVGNFRLFLVGILLSAAAFEHLFENPNDSSEDDYEISSGNAHHTDGGKNHGDVHGENTHGGFNNLIRSDRKTKTVTVGAVESIHESPDDPPKDEVVSVEQTGLECLFSNVCSNTIIHNLND